MKNIFREEAGMKERELLFKWKNSDHDKKARELVGQMTVEEAGEQLLHRAPANVRLGIPEYNWWSEGLHGVARAGTATVFPQAIGLAAMFDDGLLKEIADIISTEARAKYNAAVLEGDRDIYKGLTYWSPNINIFRDPHWGRGHETYGEDPYLTSRLGAAFIKGMQGEGKYLKTAACAKHFAVHSGPERLRHEFNAVATPKDMQETYLPAFETAVREAGVEAVMGAYNAVDGEPCCANSFLLKETLRDKWGFDGHVVSDCWAVRDFHEHHHYTENGPQSASVAVRRGCDINCGCTYENLMEGLRQGLITEEEIRTSAFRAMRTRMRLGMFADDCEYDEIPYTVVHQDSHQQKALEAAEKSVVLLKNDGILPLEAEKIRTIGVIGPNAYSPASLYGNYNGDSDHWITNLDGIRMEAVKRNIRVMYSKGCDLYRSADDGLARAGRLESEAMAVAKASDLVILSLGLDHTLEGEEGDTGNQDASGDKVDLLLPQVQRHLYERLIKLGKPLVLVLNSGSCLDVSKYERDTNAVLQAWYSGEKGGEALARILFGSTVPSGRLPLTFYYEEQPQPDFTDYHMMGRTYKFLWDKPAYPFGYGLSYTSFTYNDLLLETYEEEVLCGRVSVTNTGEYAADEVVEGYLRYEGEAFEKPAFVLCFFKRIRLNAGERTEVVFRIRTHELESVDRDGMRHVLNGSYTLFMGGSAPDDRSVELMGVRPACLRFEMRDGAMLVHSI